MMMQTFMKKKSKKCSSNRAMKPQLKWWVTMKSKRQKVKSMSRKKRRRIKRISRGWKMVLVSRMRA